MTLHIISFPFFKDERGATWKVLFDKGSTNLSLIVFFLFFFSNASRITRRIKSRRRIVYFLHVAYILFTYLLHFI